MEFNKPVSNPMLVGAMELIKAEDSPEHRNMFIGEMVKAHFLAPAVIMPAPEEGPAGELRLVPGSQIQFPMLSTQDGKYFFMAFTDRMEWNKWKESEGKHTFSVTFDDLAGMLLKKDSQGKVSPALGFVINPFGANMIIPREMVAGLIAARQAQNGQGGPNGQPSGQPAPNH